MTAEPPEEVKSPAIAGERSMPSLHELKSRWFIPMDGSHLDGIPCRRMPSGGANPLSVSTDGNTVTPLIDGKEYMRTWREGLLALHRESNAEFYHAGWRFEGLKTLGATAPGSDAVEDVSHAKREGVSTYVLACCNLGCIRFNQPSLRRLRLQGVRTAYLDSRFPLWGSNHQKFAIMKSSTAASVVLGSVDIAKTRWDSSEHLAVNPDRDPKYGKQTHETAVHIEGPAVTDVERTFRERWNDSTRTLGLQPILSTKPLITTAFSSFPGRGTHSVQVLRTYGITAAAIGYSWSPVGEFTVWASYLNALKRASSYIYIEDQYFLPFDWPPCHARTGLARDTDIVYQLGEAMKRGVNVIVVTPNTATSVWRRHLTYHRDVGVNYLRSVRAGGSPGDIVVASLRCDGSDIYVHSKLMIVDDEFISIGSANVGQRSMTCDSELHVGIVDEANVLAKEFRMKLWEEHTGLPAESLSDPDVAFDIFRTSVDECHGNLRPYPVNPLSVYPPNTTSTPPPPRQASIIRRGIDPYAGPRGLR
jgi:phosphatidylserine/phosphatidylglycerophosphate/cardiolipin synthase-like enzyme